MGGKKSSRESPFAVGLLQCIGTLGTEARDAEDPKDDFPDKWAFYLANDASVPRVPMHWSNPTAKGDSRLLFFPPTGL